MFPPIQLTEPKTLILKPQTVVILLDALSQLRYKDAAPIFDEIVPQLQKKEDETVPTA